jgi:hypothetical protein
MQDYAVLYLLSTVFVLRDLYCTYRLVRMQTRLSCTYVYVLYVAVGTNAYVIIRILKATRMSSRRYVLVVAVPSQYHTVP